MIDYTEFFKGNNLLDLFKKLEPISGETVVHYRSLYELHRKNERLNYQDFLYRSFLSLLDHYSDYTAFKINEKDETKRWSISSILITTLISSGQEYMNKRGLTR